MVILEDLGITGDDVVDKIKVQCKDKILFHYLFPGLIITLENVIMETFSING